VAASFQVSHACFPNRGSDGRREELRWRGGEVFFKNPAQITECFSDGQGVGILVSKSCGGRSPGLDVGVAVAPGDDQDHPAAEGTMVLVLSAVVPWALRNAKAFQGVDQKAGEARCSLAVALGPSFLSHLKQKQGKQSGTGAKGSR
jgi:hypothetical protein